MYRANLFRENHYNETFAEDIELVRKFHHALVAISDTKFELHLENGKHLVYPIKFVNNDGYTTTHEGVFENGRNFRLIQPIGIALLSSNTQHNAKGGFSLGSINPDGYGSFFTLTEKDDYRNHSVEAANEKQHIAKLIEVIGIYAAADNSEKFLEMSKRLVAIHEKTPINFAEYPNGLTLVYVLNQVKESFSLQEQAIIDKM